MKRKKAMMGVLWLSCLFALSVASAQNRSTAAAKALVEQAVAAFNKGDYEKTVTLCKKAVDADAKYVRAYTWLGTAYVKQDKRDLAREAFKKVLEIAPKGPDADRAREGIAKLDELQKAEDVARLTQEAQQLLNRKQNSEAAAKARQAMGLDAKNAYAHALLANALLRQGETAEGEKESREALQLDERCVLAHVGLASAHLSQKRYSAAEASYRRAIELDPNCLDAHDGLGNLYLMQQRYEEAERVLKRTIELDPGAAGAHSRLGDVYFVQGRIKEAEGAYKRSLGLDPKNVGAHKGLGNVYYNEERYDDAIREYREALKMNANDDSTFASLERALKAKTDKQNLSVKQPEKPQNPPENRPNNPPENPPGNPPGKQDTTPKTTKVTLFEGAKIRVELAEELSSRRAKKGQEVRYYVKEDVLGPNQEVLIRKGAAVTGIVTEAKSAGGLGRKGKLEFTVESVVAVDGTKVPLRARQNAVGKGQSGAVAAGVILFGVFGGFIKGNNVTIDKGTVFDAFIDRSIEIEIRTPPPSK